VPKTVVHVMPRPAIYRAGAVWVTATNWSRATARRWGHSVMWTGDAVRSGQGRPDEEHASKAASARRVPLPRAASTLAKDLRWVREDRRFVVEKVLRELEGYEPQFVWQHHDLFLNGGTRLARRLEIPLVQFVDAMIVWEARRWGVTRRVTGAAVQRLGEYPALRAADLIACVTEEVADQVVASGCSGDRIVVTPCTAEIEDFVVSESQKLEWRRRLGLEDQSAIGWVGSFRRFHEIGVLIDAMPRVLEKDPTVRLVLVGDGPERQALLHEAAYAGIADAVIAPGSVSHAEIPKLLAALDITVLTAAAGQDFHYSPLKLREYLAAGRPVVAPRIGDPARILEHGVTGRLYPPGDSAALAAELRELISSPQQAESMATRGREMHRRTGQMDLQLDLIAASLRLA
jgi:glycosyltransferase involved in cell wall biosynthesis